MKKKIIQFGNKLLVKKKLRIMRILKYGKDQRFLDLKSNKIYLDVNGELEYIIKKTNPFKEDLRKERYENWIKNFFLKQSENNIAKLSYFLAQSQSQNKQDLFVLANMNFKENGFFVEFGATNGIDISNSYLLEKEFQWTGILAEPARGYHKALRENRNCIIETDCVWKKSNEKLLFIENGVLSTLNEFKDSDMHTRNSQTEYSVNTISLNDLLEKNNSPKVIDYLSIDTEGSEFKILNSFDFSKYEIKIITVEHNYTQSREKIFNLLSSNGYNRVLTDVSAYDDWYLLENYEK